MTFSTQCINVRFAGEAAADVGGPLREFLTLAMKRFSSISGLLFGSNSSVCFKMVPESLVKKDYYKLGQLVGLSVLYTGRGPHCLNPAIVNEIYGQKQVSPLIIEDAELMHKLDKIGNGHNDDLFDMNITPTENRKECEELFTFAHVLIRNAGAIQQFKDGIKSISPILISKESFEVMKTFLLVTNERIPLEGFLGLFTFHNKSEPGSNEYIKKRNLICDLEVFLAEVYNGDVEGVCGDGDVEGYIPEDLQARHVKYVLNQIKSIA